MPDRSADDAALLVEARAGSMAAFEEIVRRHEPRLHRFLTHWTGNPDDARDLAQRAFIRLYRHLPRHRAGARLEPWLFTVARRLAIDLLRARRDAVPIEDARLAPPAAPPPMGDLWAFARAMLGARSYALLWLRYGEDLSVQEAAARCGCSAVAARVSLHRARRVLARALRADAREPEPVKHGAGRRPVLEVPS